MNKPTIYLIIAAVVIILGLFSITGGNSNDASFESTSVTEIQVPAVKPSSSPSQATSSANPLSAIPKESPVAESSAVVKPDLVTSESKLTPEEALASERVLNNFESSSKIQIPKAFTNMVFKDLQELSDGSTSGIIGHSKNSDVTFAMISQSGYSNEEKIKFFIRDEISDQLKMSISKESLSHPQIVEPTPNSGFSSVKVWTIKEKGKIAIITLAKRSDKSGSYLNILNGPAAHFEKNEQHYDEILSQIKTK